MVNTSSGDARDGIGDHLVEDVVPTSSSGSLTIIKSLFTTSRTKEMGLGNQSTKNKEDLRGLHSLRLASRRMNELSLQERTSRAFKLSMYLGVYGFLSLVPFCIFWVGGMYHPFSENFRVNTTAKEPLILVEPRGHGVSWLNVWYEGLFSISRIYPALCFILYLKIGWRKLIVIAFGAIVGYVCYLLSRGFMPFMALIFPSLITLIALKLVLPRDSKVLTHAGLQVLAIFGVMMMFMIFRELDKQTEMDRILIVCIYFPFGKEIVYMIVRYSMGKLTLSKSIGGTGVGVRRNTCWSFSIWYQCGVALMQRLVYTNLQPSLLILVVLYNAFLEIVSRLTMSRRDEFLERLKGSVCCCCCNWGRNSTPCWSGSQVEDDENANHKSGKDDSLRTRRRTTLVLPFQQANEKKVRASSFAISATIATDDDFKATIKQFYSMCIVSEMLCEYFAVICAPLLVYFLQDWKLFVPLNYYETMHDPFTEGISVNALANSFIIQVCTEVLVDTICIVYEEKHGCDLLNAWNKRSRLFGLICILGGWFANNGLWLFLVFQDPFTEACKGRDMCYCAYPNGLKLGGLRQSYCELLYPNTSGVPPA